MSSSNQGLAHPENLLRTEAYVASKDAMHDFLSTQDVAEEDHNDTVPEPPSPPASKFPTLVARTPSTQALPTASEPVRTLGPITETIDAWERSTQYNAELVLHTSEGLDITIPLLDVDMALTSVDGVRAWRFIASKDNFVVDIKAGSSFSSTILCPAKDIEVHNAQLQYTLGAFRKSAFPLVILGALG